MALSEKEIRELVRTEIQNEMGTLRESINEYAQTSATAAANASKALERLSLVVVGDEMLQVPGLVRDVQRLKEQGTVNALERAKLLGIWVGVSVIGLGVLKVLWTAIERWLEKN